MIQEKSNHSGVTGGLPLVQYAKAANGGRCRISSADTGIVDVVNEQAWQALGAEVAEARRLVEGGKVSPIHYYMVVNQMTPRLLGKYMGFSVWRVRWHLRAAGFRRLSSAMLRRYAELFKVSEDDLRRGVLRAALYEQSCNLGGAAAPEQL
ncbi:hypothetical protein [Desulfurivibrio alkaliphilus]|uniref:Uncharacterized protein n=1 Tax=Desulfurivibrio alkaliphilus (strain DSM 19089 / UNIQEM U267 / AHT2) TaxID=589865 RepID=D6Z2R7_DESAT|nr:hypothetical protein [Desulfurivibrio alkaliphilus]ADH85842.1 conserved hypothetical protein [Desulfurivibrio alkaliphilus AHT 2]